MNSQEDIQQKIAEYYQKLPQKAQDSFSSMKWLEILQSISEKYGLKPEQIETLGTETTLVLLGIIHLDEYKEILKNNLALDEEKIKEIDETVLGPIRPDLEVAYENNLKAVSEQYQKKLDERFEKIPGEIKDMIQESDYQQVLYEIGKKHSLTVSQMDSMERETVQVMAGINSPRNFESALARELKISGEESLEIAKEINERVFSLIRETLKKTTEKVREEKPELKVISEEPINTERNQEIKIQGIKPNMEIPELPAGEKEVELPSPAEPRIPRPNLSEKPEPAVLPKLSGIFKAPVKTTAYSMPSLVDTGTKLKADPYREIPE